MLCGCIDNLLQVIRTAEIARVYPDPLGAMLHCCHSQPPVEMDIGYQRDGNRLANQPKCACAIKIGNRDPDDLAASGFKPMDLLCRLFGIGGRR